MTMVLSKQQQSKKYSVQIVVVAAISIFLSLITVSPVGAICDESDFECDNGDCIDIGDLCNGQIDCKDQSDESAYNCMHQTCPPYSFRCAYGACIFQKMKCDGKKDCADGSDESLRLCRDKDDLNRIIQGSCGDYMMECAPGICVEISHLCDGKYDCENHLDESIEMCGFNECPKYSFQCAYGACLLPSAKCNNTYECHDRSDEAYELCGYKRIINAIPGNENDVGNAANYVLNNDDNNDFFINQNPNLCLLPRKRPNLIIQAMGQTLRGSIAKNTFVRYSCEPGFSLVGNTKGFCRGPQMVAFFPKCEKFCRRSEILGDFTLNAVQCHYGNDSFQCEESTPIRPGTKVSLKCAAYFSPQQERHRFCTTEGEWSPFANDCSMYCGTTLNPFARGGIDVAKSEIPWHVGIYATYDSETYKYSCGGTILSPLIVISAAHCFFDPVTRSSRSNEDFQVVAGKYYRNYYKTEPNAQIRNVSNILLHKDYQHTELLQNDLAIISLAEPLLFTSSIRPICLDFIDHFSNSIGRLSAWGRSRNQAEKLEVLQIVSGEHLKRDTCLKLSLDSFSSDKFCMKYVDQGVACRGDSGGGYFIKHNKQHYLIGVLSIASEIDTADCSLNDGVLFLSNTTLYIEWIKDTIRESERLYKIEQKSKFS